MREAFGLTDPGCVRRNNEDCYLVAPEIGLYVVADGMGGAQAGEHASKIAVETVASVVEQSEHPSAAALTSAFHEANNRVMSAAAGDATLEGMGTTLVAVLENGPELLISSVGDSRVYLFQDGELKSITEDQTWVHEVGRRLGLDDVTLRTHPMRHVLTMAIGVSPELRIHSYALTPPPGSLVLLSSDGLHGVVENDAMAKTLSGNGSLESKCQRLIESAKESGGPDNITAVLLKSN